MSKRMIVLNQWICEASPCLCILNTACADEGANGFYGKGSLAMAGSCDAFLKKQFHCSLHWRWTGWVDMTGISRPGVQNPNPAHAVGLSCPPQEERGLVCQGWRSVHALWTQSSCKTLLVSSARGLMCMVVAMRPKDLNWRKPPQSDDVHAGWVCRHHFQIGQHLLVWESRISYLEESFWMGCRHAIL